MKPVKRDLLAAVMPLVAAAAASGAEIGQTSPQILAFNLFGQGVACFQSAQTLIADGQSSEALPSLRGLVIIAARFEQMTEEHGEGLGLVIRLALDSLDDETLEHITDWADTARSGLLQVAALAGLVVPDDVRPAESSTIWHGLTAEMQMARRSIEGSYGMVGLHVRPVDGANTVGFDTRLKPGRFTDLITSACVIAQLELLKHAAPIFGWTINTEMIDALLTEAKELNEASARSDASGSTITEAIES